MRILVFVISTYFSFSLFCQDLAYYADVMINADAPQHREYAARKFEKMFDEALGVEGSFTNAFEELKWVNFQYPQDSSFRVISWQIQYEEGMFRYGTILQLDNGEIIQNAGRRGQSTQSLKSSLDFEKWRGGLVYNIVQPKAGEYYLQTYTVIDKFTKMKTLEPLQLEHGTATLGIDHLFRSPDHRSARVVMEYSMDANASIKYLLEVDRFVLDHLVLMQGRMPGQGPTQVPDGTYQAYDREEDHWELVDMLEMDSSRGPLDPAMKSKLNNELFKTGN